MVPRYLEKFTSRKVKGADDAPGAVPDSLAAWIERYRQLAVVGVRSTAVADKIALHLGRFREFFAAAYGHDRASTCRHCQVKLVLDQARRESGEATPRSGTDWRSDP